MSDFTKDVNEDDFDSMVINSDKPVLVDFWAEWCGPCKMLTPTIDAISEEYNDKSVIVKVNVDEAPAIATKYGIRSIPSLLFFNNGEVVEQKVGAVSKDELTAVLDKLIEG
ncbi:MAG: thioredoxin [Candidatus Marinimicrobia bacterium]|nr:thioredoxin [Candidatus Neomarinimicrobiota bacterium]|tara:strand:- start:1899 stop:2231 length:333 start_codon:yes stop_codon:yes gene_type:complete